MLRRIRFGLLAVVILFWIAPAQISAYSYGDANTEEVAETFKLIESSLSGASPDWKAAEDAHKARFSEIQSHFGDSVAETLNKNFEDKDAKLLIDNYKAVLTMNLDRRFTYALKDVKNYAGTKLLLAKAKATFDTMTPYIASGTQEITKAFDEALDALGNPGLFGVGKKEADPALFKTKVDSIYAIVKPLFPFKAYIKATPVITAKPVNQPTPSKKPAATVQPSAGSEATPIPTAEASASATPSESPSPQPASAPEAAATAVPSIDDKPVESAAPDSSIVEATPEVTEQVTQEAGVEHAPMERLDKTNTPVTLIVILGVLVIGGGVIWFIRKKGLL